MAADAHDYLCRKKIYTSLFGLELLVWIDCVHFRIVHLRRWWTSIVPRRNAFTWRNRYGTLRLRRSGGSVTHRRLRGWSSRISVSQANFINVDVSHLFVFEEVAESAGFLNFKNLIEMLLIPPPPLINYWMQSEDHNEISGITDDVFHRAHPVAHLARRIEAQDAQDPVRYAAGNRFFVHQSDCQHWRRRSRQHQ